MQLTQIPEAIAKAEVHAQIRKALLFIAIIRSLSI